LLSHITEWWCAC